MLDVVLGVEYMHHGNPEAVVHCDLKPGNVLLDEDMVAHVGDFGIAKILVENQTTQTKTLGTIGYIAPGNSFFNLLVHIYFSCKDKVIIFSNLMSSLKAIISNLSHNSLFEV